MVFLFTTAVLALSWIAPTLLLAAAFPSKGSAIWIAPAPTAVIAECYPLSIQFTSPVAPNNISFFYYVGVQTSAGETVVPIATWPESMWKDGSTSYSAYVASVPIAAGTMMALRIWNYDGSKSYLLQIVLQPNTDESCITSANQQGAADYNGLLSRLPATTTVSPATRSSSPVPASVTLPTSSSTSSSIVRSPATSSVAAPPNPTGTATSVAAAAVTSSSSGDIVSSSASQSNSSPPSASTPLAASLNSPSTTSVPSKPSNRAAIIAGTTIASLLGLSLAATAGACYARRQHRRMAEVKERAADPFVQREVIREVDGGCSWRSRNASRRSMSIFLVRLQHRARGDSRVGGVRGVCNIIHCAFL
ncbi:hypothetical protein FB451DRAFT_1261441 [Mycena latifolia]|nr:hypothetical protein FB451DRAFT_1261441 [Mycena latifolia]